MLLFILATFSWSLIKADLLLSSKNAINKNKSVLTTSGNLSKRNLFFEVTPLDINTNLTHYDWSVSDENIFENQQYNYKDVWWVTIRDFYKLISPTKTTHAKLYQKKPEYTTESYVGTSTNKNNNGTQTANNKDNDVNNNSVVRINDLDLTRAGQLKDLKKYFKTRLTNGVFKEDDPRDSKINKNIAGSRARANAMKRNKQIQRMLVEIAPEVLNYTTNDTAKSIAEGSKNFDMNIAKFGQDNNLNINYKKVVENLELSLSANNMNELGSLKLKDLKKYYKFDGRPHPTEMTVEEVSNAIHRQGIPPQTTPPEAETRGPIKGGGPPWMQGNRWRTTSRPSELTEDLKRQLSLPRTGYFSVFVRGCTRAISEKPDKDVRLLGLSLEREYLVLFNQDKYILSFGQPFLSSLETFATHFQTLPPDYVKHQAMILHQAMLHRQEYMTKELNSIIDYIDNLFEENEGLELFKVVELINNYPNTTQNSFEVLRAMSTAVFAPYRRLSGSIKRQILIDSINDYLRKFNTHLPTHTDTEFENVNYTKHIRRRFNNKTRYEVVGRDDKNKTTVRVYENKRAKQSHKEIIDCFGKGCIADEKAKHEYVNKKTTLTKTKDNEIKYMKRNTLKGAIKNRKQSVARLRLTSKYSTTRPKQHTEKNFKQKHPKIYDKYMKLRYKVHKNHKKRLKLKESKNGKYKSFIKFNDNEKLSKIKQEKLKDNNVYNISETDFEDFNINDKTSYYSDSDTNNSEINKVYPKGIAVNVGNRKPTSKSKISKSYALNLPKNNSIFTESQKKYSKLNANKVTTKNRVPFCKTNKISNNTVEIYFKNNTVTKPVTVVTNHEARNNVNKHNNNKNKTFPDKDISESSERYISTKLTDTLKGATVKNKITDLTSYSDEEDIIKFKISDSLRHGKDYLKPIRRYYPIKNKFKKGINKFSSYSSEEVILKSNIYKTLGFQKFDTPHETMLRANDKDDDDLKGKKIRIEKFKAVNEMSSYSDEEAILKEKLNV